MHETPAPWESLMHRGDGDQSNPWALIRREDKFDCRYYTARRDIVALQGGEERIYTHIHMKHLGVAVVPIDDDGTTTLVGQYRYVLDRYTWEIPKGGGRRDQHPSTQPSGNSAKRRVSAPITGCSSLPLPPPPGSPTPQPRGSLPGAFMEATHIQILKK